MKGELLNMYPNKYFYKILLFGIIISSLPIFLVGFFTYSKSSETIQKKSNHAVQDHLVRIQNSVEQVLRTTDHSLTHFSNSTFLLQSLSEPLYVEQFQLLRQIQQELNHLQTFDTGISDIILLSKEKQWYINNIGLHRLKSHEEAEQLLQHFELPIDSIWEVGEQEGHSAYIQLIKKLPINAATKKGLAIAQIPVRYLEHLISYDHDNESVMMIDRNQQTFFHANAEVLQGMDIHTDVLSHISQQSQPTGQFQTGNHQSKFTVTYRKSDYNSWTYISLISINELTQESRSIGWYTSIVCLSLLLLTLIMAWFVSQNIYNPIRKLFRFSETVFLPESNDQPKDGFEYLTEQIRHVVDTNTLLHSRLQSQVEQLKILFIVKLLGDQLSSNEISEKLHSLGFNPSWTMLSVLTLQIDTLEGTKYQHNDLDLLLFAINNIVEELITADRRLSPIVIDQSQVTILLSNHSSPTELKAEIYQLTQNIQQQIDHYLQLRVSVGISLPYEQLSKTYQAYQESLDALKNRLRLGGNSIIYYQELPQGGYPTHAFFPTHLQNDLSDAIKLADREQVDQLLTAFFNDLVHKKAGPLEYEMGTARLVIELIQLTHSLGIHYVSLTDNQSIFEQMFKLRSVKEYQDWLRFIIIEPIILTVEERLHAQYKGISEKIIAIIHEDYEQDLSLDTLAARLHYNPSYISSVFRKETGIPFSDYLARYRHGKAIAYLVKTDIPIREISMKLQYTNPQNFIRSFRRTEGVTPGQYREKNRSH